MNIQKYKGQSNKNYKIILIVLLLLTFILIFMGILLSFLNKNVEKENKFSYESLNTIKDVIEYYDSKYISEEENKNDNFYLEVKLELKYMPYEEDDTSNEEYYTKLLNDSAKVLRYKNFIFQDEKNNLTIKVICKNGKIDTITINDIEDYFLFMDSQISMKKYKEIPNVNLEISSNILNECINQSWNNSVNFGTRDSIFNEYYIYFDEGIKVRVIDNKIYNVIFTTNYKENVISNLFPGVDLQNVKAVLGTPSFEDNENKILGYKNDKIYAFFTNSEISIYRNSEVSSDDFFKLSDKLLDESIDILEFMNELTYLWPDYSIYTYKSDYVYISYPLKGIEIKLNYDDTNGILVYNNIKSSMSKVGRYLENTDYISRLQIDLVFQTEQKRVKEKNEYINKCNEYKNNLEDEIKNTVGESINYSILPEKDSNGYIYSIKFISTFETAPDRELNDTVNTYMWVGPNYFIYSKSNKGIYFLDLTTGKITRLLEGTEDYKLKSYKDGILKFDNEEVELSF